MPAQRSGRAEDPVREVAKRTTEQQPENDRPRRGLQGPGGPRDDRDNRDGHQAEQDRRATGEAEGGTGIAREAEIEHARHQIDRRPVGQVRHHNDLRDHVDGDDRETGAEQRGHRFARPNSS